METVWARAVTDLGLSAMGAKRYLIVNADDFGQSEGVNQGVIEAHERGLVTSASLMVHWPAAIEAAAYSREHPSLSLGLHVDLGEWTYDGDRWLPLYDRVPVHDMAGVTAEVARQLTMFRRLVGKAPTHIDSHQHVHRREPSRAVLIALARKLAVPLRHFSAAVRYCGYFYGQTAEGHPLPHAITVTGLINILTTLPPGFTELGCHPGIGHDLATMYRRKRAEEVRTLCDPQLRTALVVMEIELRSFLGLPHLTSRGHGMA
jgi:predicted glycoside hydrolase/deacetylase ChbG (UPF0249 family)